MRGGGIPGGLGTPVVSVVTYSRYYPEGDFGLLLT